MSYHEAREVFVDCLQAVPLFDIETIQGSSWDEKVLGLVKVFCVGCVFGFFVLFSVIDECWAMCV